MSTAKEVNVHLDYTVRLGISVREAERLAKGDERTEHDLIRQAQKIVARSADEDINMPAIRFSDASIEPVDE